MTQPSHRHHRVPYRRTQRVLAALLALGCVIGIVVLLAGGSPRSWVLDRYRQESHDSTTGRYTLVSERTVSDTAAEIRKRWKPAEQVVDPSGIFLRYQDLIVAVLPRPTGGSTVTVDDERHGYTSYYGHVGGFWGVGSPVDGTRGGGPGAGK